MVQRFAEPARVRRPAPGVSPQMTPDVPLPGLGRKVWRARNALVQSGTNLELHIIERSQVEGPNELSGSRMKHTGDPVLRTFLMQTTGAQVDITETQWIDDAMYVYNYSLFAGLPPKRRRMQNNAVSWVAKIHTGGQSANVSVACLDGHSDGITDYFAFNTFAIAATRSVSVYSGFSGVLLQASITAKALTTPCYPMFLDLASSTAPTSGVTTPIPGSVGSIMSAAGVQDNYSDQNSQGIVAFANGLWFALSTTPDVWTDPGVGNTAVGSATVGV